MKEKENNEATPRICCLEWCHSSLSSHVKSQEFEKVSDWEQSCSSSQKAQGTWLCMNQRLWNSGQVLA
jgi:hypothetical protein